MNPRLQRFFLAFAATAGCSGAGALPPEMPEASRMTSAQLRAVYLECDRLATQFVLPPDEMVQCGTVSDVLLHRDFGGVLELQLQWWRHARAQVAAPAARHDDAANRAARVPIGQRLEP